MAQPELKTGADYMIKIKDLSTRLEGLSSDGMSVPQLTSFSIARISISELMKKAGERKGKKTLKAKYVAQVDRTEQVINELAAGAPVRVQTPAPELVVAPVPAQNKKRPGRLS